MTRPSRTESTTRKPGPIRVPSRKPADRRRSFGPLLRRLFSASRDGMIVYDRRGAVVDANPSACQLLSVTRETLLKNGFEHVATPVGFDDARRQFNLCRRLRPRNRQLVLVRPDGSRRVLSFERTCSEGVLTLAVLRNVTPQTEEQESLRRHARVFDHLYDAVMVIDMRGGITDWNPGAERLFGFTRNEMLGRSPDAIYRDRQDSVVQPGILSELMRTRGWSGQVTCLRKDGTERLCETVAIPMRDDGGKLIEILGIFRDKTEQTRAIRLARQREDELAHLARVNTLSELASGIAHELNQPLTAIVSGAQACLRLIQTRKADRSLLIESLEDVAAQGQRAAGIIRQLRDFIRKQEPEWRKLSLVDLVRDVQRLAKADARRHEVHVGSVVRSAVTHVTGDRIQIQQVLLNLVQNAVEALSEVQDRPRRLRIAIRRRAPRTIEISVIDNGPGIAADELRRVFHPFHTTKAGGLGVGLSIGQSIVLAHGGQLWGRSRPGRGSVFRFTLPISDGGTSHDR